MKPLILKVQTAKQTEIFIANNLNKTFKNYISTRYPSKVVYITDSNLIEKLNNYCSPEKENILVLQPGEKEKNLENLKKIIDFLLEKNIDKKSLIVGFGGGVISDIAGFAASIFYRGIPVVFIPTTLLAQVDASIGGKNTINLNKIKNVLGTFYQPSAIFIDTENLKGLSDREFNSGLGEIIKYGVGFDKSIVEILNFACHLDANSLIKLITKSVTIKKEIVEKDQEEKGRIRKLLNLGHTLGHALEAQENLQLTHGEGVAIGLSFSAFVAQELGNITQQEYIAIVELLDKYKLPTNINFDIKKTIEKIKFDKKKTGVEIEFITLKKIGEAYIYQFSLKEIEEFLYKFSRATFKRPLTSR